MQGPQDPPATKCLWYVSTYRTWCSPLQGRARVRAVSLACQRVVGGRKTSCPLGQHKIPTADASLQLLDKPSVAAVALARGFGLAVIHIDAWRPSLTVERCYGTPHPSVGPTLVTVLDLAVVAALASTSARETNARAKWATPMLPPPCSEHHRAPVALDEAWRPESLVTSLLSSVEEVAVGARHQLHCLVVGLRVWAARASRAREGRVFGSNRQPRPQRPLPRLQPAVGYAAQPRLIEPIVFASARGALPPACSSRTPSSEA